jgi:Mitochondrial carrier protein
VGVTSKSNFIMKFSAGSLAGAIGSTVGNPFDVLKTVTALTFTYLALDANYVYSTENDDF